MGGKAVLQNGEGAMALQRRRRRRADKPQRPQWGGLCPRLNTVSSSDVAFDYRENRALVSPQTNVPIKQSVRRELLPPSLGIVVATLSRLSVESKQASGHAGGRCSH